MVKLGLGSLQRLWAPPEPKGRPVLILKSVVFESQGSHRSALQGPARSPAYIVEMLMGLVRVAGGAGRRNECPLEVWSTNGALCIFEFLVADISEKRNECPLEVWSTKREKELITHSAQLPWELFGKAPAGLEPCGAARPPPPPFGRHGAACRDGR